jgi:predicted permease
MPRVLTIVLTIIAPIIAVAGLGVWVDKARPLETKSLSRLIIYLTSPALIFYGMANASIQPAELLDLLVLSTVVLVSTTAIAWAITVLFKMPRVTASGFVLAVSLTNIGNYGIPFNEFAFGQAGLERAVVITVVFGLYAHTVGVFVASWGRAPISQAFKNVLKIPAPYAAALGLLVNFGYIDLPDLVNRIVYILQGAAIPLMLILLGVQIGRVKFSSKHWQLVLGASGLRLIGGAVIGWGAAGILGLSGVTRQVAIIEAAMPTAVIASILATEFDSDAELVSSITLVSTLLSVVTLSVLLFILTL